MGLFLLNSIGQLCRRGEEKTWLRHRRLSPTIPRARRRSVVGVTADLTGANNAVQMVQAGVAELGGKGGGGRPDMAQAGGPNGSGGRCAGCDQTAIGTWCRQIEFSDLDDHAVFGGP